MPIIKRTLRIVILAMDEPVEEFTTFEIPQDYPPLDVRFATGDDRIAHVTIADEDWG